MYEVFLKNWYQEIPNDIQEEVMYSCDSIEDAWKLAWESTKIYQNINRTHPLKKLISQDIKLKNSERITNRIQRHEY